MKLALFQPILLPTLFDLACLLPADQVVWMDTVRWSRKGSTHRAMIRTPEGRSYLNVPVRT
ncbi:MAG: WbqC family protein, partial [Balneolaceae bacterium]